MKTIEIVYEEVKLGAIRVSDDSRIVDIDVAGVEECLRALNKPWAPQSRLMFIARLASAAMRGVRGYDGSFERAPRDVKLEDEIVAEFIRVRGFVGAERIFRELRVRDEERRLRST